jgi:hypothetical protein
MIDTQAVPCSSASALFPLGEVTATHQILWDIPRVELFSLLEKHAMGNWGKIKEQQRSKNLAALENGGEIVSIFQAGGHSVHIRTQTSTLETFISSDADSAKQ